jgi:carboxypeptidase T
MAHRSPIAQSALVVALVLVSLTGSWSQAVTSPSTGLSEPVVVRLYVKDRNQLNAVSGELDIWEAHLAAGYVLAAVTPDQVQWLQSLGYRLAVDAGKTALLAVDALLDPRFHYFDDYQSNANGLYVVDFLQAINAAYPDLTELYDIGDAWMASQPDEHDRDIWVLRVTNEDPDYGAIGDKPVFFLLATIHAREVAVPELAIRYIQYLTAGYEGEGGYGVDPDVTWLVDHNVAYVLVMQNPDGHWVNEQNSSAYRRKNMDWDDGCSFPGEWGVDLNRNHSFLWGCCGGSSGNPCVWSYRGPSRGSEPETQAFESFFATVMLDQNGPNGDDEIPSAAPDDTTGIFISLHSYGDLVLWPWGFSGYGNPPNYSQLQTIGRKFAAYTGYDPSGTIAYSVDGATDDWTYGKFGVPSYTFEIGPSSGSCGGFFPVYECIDGYAGRDFWAENRPALLYAHKIARTPYRTAYGPDTQTESVVPDEVLPGTSVQLRANVADHRYGSDPLQPIAAAEYFLDAPAGDGTGIPMVPSDGTWGDLSEDVKAVVDTSGLALGRHTILVHGQNDDGDWGPFSAVFLGVVDQVYLPIVVRNK